MNRYFLEVAYHGGSYSGFQRQINAHTVQAELEKALRIFYKKELLLTGSSRTDAGVHALQNYFHTDTEVLPTAKDIYHLNAILPGSLVLKNIYRVNQDHHARFDALSREYHYFIHQAKNPFWEGQSYYFPYRLDWDLLQEAADLLLGEADFSSFSKRNTQVKTYRCRIMESRWEREGDRMVYKVRGNRFLRGMVRGLVGTMLKVGRGKITLADFKTIMTVGDQSKADFSVPGGGLFLVNVLFPYPLEPLGV